MDEAQDLAAAHWRMLRAIVPGVEARLARAGIPATRARDTLHITWHGTPAPSSAPPTEPTRRARADPEDRPRST
ncbi:hypothetical protein ACFQY7_20565 [Actinomadura luteofluorescens]|uniref:hypothetical protein n=1 Tax=Actinomadura luteofluorescens TaxID=46163 RepID=UPI0036320D07